MADVDGEGAMVEANESLSGVRVREMDPCKKMGFKCVSERRLTRSRTSLADG